MSDDDSLGPLPSETAMFRVVVGVGLALVPVFALSLVVSPLAAAILLGFEIGIVVGVLWRRRAAARATDRRSAAGSRPGP
ncbi:MAG: hypothetical protein QOI10_477 [Solirubrobacterales bacterium]|jgi:hypothetical protein|nr:hypothetical protein [Solirubrobacterales bacterium]